MIWIEAEFANFPVFSLVNSEFGGDGFARDWFHHHPPFAKPKAIIRSENSAALSGT